MKNTRHRHDYTVQHDEIPLDEYTPQHWYTPQDEYRLKKDYTSWPWTHITVWLHTLGWIHDTAKIHTLGAMHASGWIQTIWTIHVTAWNHTVACTYTTGRISICATASCNFVRSSRFQLRMWLKNLHKTKEIVSILFPPFGKSRPHQSTEKSPKIMLLNHSQIILDKPMEFEKVQNQRSCRNSTGF